MEPTELNPVRLDRAAGVLVAAAAGDALGAGYEFARPPSENAVTMRPGRLTRRPAGSWTDDTDMAVAIARVAATGARLDEASGLDAVAAGFLEWYRDGPDDIGMQTRSVLAAAKDDPRRLAQCAKAYAKAHEKSAGNGSLMRTGPVVLAHLGDDEKIVRAAGLVSSLTHDDPLAREACALWCLAIDRAIREGRMDGLHEATDLLPANRGAYWRERLAEAEQPAPTVIRSNAFVVRALQAAWWAIWSTSDRKGPSHLDAALRRAVAIGDDTDTVAAIAGALLGARYGASAVPFEWRRHLTGWPGYRAADIVGLAVLAVRGGQPDSAGWPTQGDLWPYYESHFGPSGAIYTLHQDERVLWGDVGALSDVTADAFVSLCRIGAAQRRGHDHFEVWLMDSDGPTQNADPAFVLADTADAIETLRREGRTVFVHCVRCESRTPAVAAAWLVRHHGMTVEDALNQVVGVMGPPSSHAPLRAALRAMR